MCDLLDQRVVVVGLPYHCQVSLFLNIVGGDLVGLYVHVQHDTPEYVHSQTMCKI